MKIYKIANAYCSEYSHQKNKQKVRKNENSKNIIVLPNNTSFPPFTRKWSEHKSWGAVINPDTKNVTFKLFSFPDNKSVNVAITDKNTGEEKIFPMTQSRSHDGIYTSGVISSKYAKHGDSYKYIITRADGEEVIVKDPYSFRQKKFMGESTLYDHSLYKWSDKSWYDSANTKRVSRQANANNKLTPVSNLRIYEFNTKTISKQGNFEGAKQELERIKNLGFNAIEIMPTEGTYSYNWGYDGVDKFAPSEHLGGPSRLKSLIEHAHNIGLNVIMDMVPNHYGPDGNTMAITGPYIKGPNDFGDALNYEGKNSKYVRDFIVNAALDWVDNYHCDGLRLDMTKYMESDYTMKQIAAEMNYHKPDAFLIAEDGRFNVQVDRHGNFKESKRVIHDRRVVNPLDPSEYGGNSSIEKIHTDAIDKISKSSEAVKLGRLGYNSEWDFSFFHALKETLYGNIDFNSLFKTMEESHNRVKYVMSHDEVGNYDGTRLLSKLMVPMLSMNDNIILNQEDLNRARQLSKLKNLNYEDALYTVKSQKAQLVCEKLVKMYLTGQFEKYSEPENEHYWFRPMKPEFIKEVLEPLGIKKESEIRPEKIREMYLKSFNLCKSALAFTYAVPGPKMVFQGDENIDITPFRFFREFQSIEDDQKNLYIEKGYNAGKKGLEESVLGNINYSDFAKNKMKNYELLTSDLNRLSEQNPAMNNGYYVLSDAIKHTLSKVIATHSVSADNNNELYTISNFEYCAYPRQDADKYYIKFPKGSWVEILNTDNTKYGGLGYINRGVIESDGINNIPIYMGRYSTMIFKKI